MMPKGAPDHDRWPLQQCWLTTMSSHARVVMYQFTRWLRILPDRRTMLQEAATGHPSFSGQGVHEKATVITCPDQMQCTPTLAQSGQSQ